LTFGILFFLYQKGMLDFSRVKSVFVNVPVVVFTFLLMLTTTIASVVRWRLLLQGQGLDVSMREAFRLTMIGVFFNTAIPGAVSGDLVKGYYVVRQQPDGRGRIRAFTTLLLDRILGLSALIFVSFFAMFLNLREVLVSPTLKPLAVLISGLFFGVILFYVFVLVEFSFTKTLQRLLLRLPAGEYFVKLLDALKAYENARHYVIKGFFISLLIHSLVISVFIILARSLGGFEMVPIDKFLFLSPLGLLVTAIPVAPAGLGTGHGAFYYLFERVGSHAGADLFMAFVTFQILISLIGGFFYIKYKGLGSGLTLDSKLAKVKES
jgi:uncharacterized protein (TIRG00374 family)